MSLLIPSHALPSLTYRVPERFAKEVRVGTAVVAPLSAYSRVGIIVGFERAPGERSLEEIRAVVGEISLPKNLVKLCSWAAKASALSLHGVLRMALPPGLDLSLYVVRHPAPDWPFKVGSTVTRSKLRGTLGGEGLKAAERAGRVALAPALPAQRTVEWAIPVEGALDSCRRAPRQRALLKALMEHDDGASVVDLLHATGAGRDVLRRLVRRGAVRSEKRPEPTPSSYTRGSGATLAEYTGGVEWALSQGGDWVWRMPRVEFVAATAAVAKATIRRGEQALVLAPEIEDVKRLVETFEMLLPAGLAVAPYHSGLGRSRVAVYEAARRGEVDVLVGTRTAMLVPMMRLGAICVVDEPNEAHRASPGYEGVPVHVRDLACARGRIEGAAVFFFSPCPSLRLYAPESGTRRLPPRAPSRWPEITVIDMQGTGALLSSTLLDACRRTVRLGGRVGVVVNRIGRIVSLSCNRCGFVRVCPVCGLSLRSQGELGVDFLFCGHCGYRGSGAKECLACGSDRLSSVGITVERVRGILANTLDVEVGLLTASEREGEGGAPVVVGTARCVLEEEWDLGVIPDADTLLFGGLDSTEKGFRFLYRAAEASKDQLLVQTRSPEHPTLQAALRGHYEAFASAELPKRRALGYPPYTHLAEITFEGAEEEVRHAVESRLRPALVSGVELLDPVPIVVPLSPGNRRLPAWRALLRSRKRAALTEAAALVARLLARDRGGLKTHINMDPEEV